MVPMVKCPTCRLTLDVMDLTLHYRTCVVQRIEHENMLKKGNPRSCEICGKHCKSYQSYTSHKLVHKEERRFQCDQCPKTFKQRTALGIHQKGVHEGRGSQHCHTCGANFKSSSQLAKHRFELHAQGEIKLCPQCGHQCYDDRLLKSHMLVHEEKKMECSYCGKCSDKEKTWWNMKGCIRGRSRSPAPSVELALHLSMVLGSTRVVCIK